MDEPLEEGASTQPSIGQLRGDVAERNESEGAKPSEKRNGWPPKPILNAPVKQGTPQVSAGGSQLSHPAIDSAQVIVAVPFCLAHWMRANGRRYWL